MENSGFFNSELINGEDDREYSAADFAQYFANFISDGVFGKTAANLQVSNTTNLGMKVVLNIGTAYIKGYWYQNTVLKDMTIDAADPTLPRIDTIVLRKVASSRNILAYVKKGVAASSPVAPVLTRDESVYEIQLAQVLVPAGSLNVLQANITDSRYDTSLCGIVTGLVTQIDTTNLFQQFEAAFATWFNLMKGQLTTDAAGNLQTQINGIIAKFLIADMSIYVATTGSDTTGTGASGAPYKTITKALAMAPKILNGFDVTINIAAGTYAEVVSINGFTGGTLNLVLAGNIIITRFEVQDSTLVKITNGSAYSITTTTTVTSPVIITNRSALKTINTNFVLPTNASYSGVSVSIASEFIVTYGSVTVTGGAAGVTFEDGSNVVIETLAGSGVVTGLVGKTGAKFSYTTKTITYTNAKVLTGGAIITNNLNKTVTVTLVAGASWQAMSGGYYQEVVANGYDIGDEPDCSLVPATPPFSSAAEKAAEALIENRKIVTNNKVTFYATAQLATNLTYKLKGE